MDINIKIINKVKELTISEPNIGNFILELLNFEAEDTSWYSTPYNQLLEKYCDKGGNDENSGN